MVDARQFLVWYNVMVEVDITHTVVVPYPFLVWYDNISKHIRYWLVVVP